MNNTMKNILSAVFAIIVALIFLYLVGFLLQVAFKIFVSFLGLIIVVVIAIPVYVILRKKLFR